MMDRTISLATDVQADRSRVFEIISTTEGQCGFWTANCDVSPDHARFGFAQAPVDLVTDVSSEPGRLVRMKVASGFPLLGGLDLGGGARRGDAFSVGDPGALSPLRLW